MVGNIWHSSEYSTNYIPYPQPLSLLCFHIALQREIRVYNIIGIIAGSHKIAAIVCVSAVLDFSGELQEAFVHGASHLCSSQALK